MAVAAARRTTSRSRSRSRSGLPTPGQESHPRRGSFRLSGWSGRAVRVQARAPACAESGASHPPQGAPGRSASLPPALGKPAGRKPLTGECSYRKVPPIGLSSASARRIRNAVTGCGRSPWRLTLTRLYGAATFRPPRQSEEGVGRRCSARRGRRRARVLPCRLRHVRLRLAGSSRQQ